MCRVEALSAEMSVVGSNRHRNDGWSPGSMTSPSDTNKRSNLPRSACRAISWMTDRSLLLVAAPSGGVIAGAEHEHAEVHLASLRRHGPAPIRGGRVSPSTTSYHLRPTCRRVDVKRRAGVAPRGISSRTSRRIGPGRDLTVLVDFDRISGRWLRALPTS